MLTWLALRAGLMWEWHRLVTPCLCGELAGTSAQDNGAVQCVCREAAAVLVPEHQHSAGFWHQRSPSPARGVQAGTPATARLPWSPRPPGYSTMDLAPTQAPTHQEHTAKSNKKC